MAEICVFMFRVGVGVDVEVSHFFLCVAKLSFCMEKLYAQRHTA